MDRLLIELVVLVGEHQPGQEWLSNSSPDPVRVDVGHGEQEYGTVEHAYQAAEEACAEDHDAVAAAGPPEQAEEHGRALQRRAGWREVRTGVVRAALAAEFVPGTAAATSSASC